MRRIVAAGFVAFAAACSPAAPNDSGPLTAMQGEFPERASWSLGPIESAEQAVELCHRRHRGALVRNRDQFVKVVEAYRRHGLRIEFPAVPVKTLFDASAVAVTGGYEVCFTALLLGTRPLEIVRLGYRVAKDGWVDVTERIVYLTGCAPNGQALVDELRHFCPEAIGPR